MEATGEQLHRILPPRLEDAGLEDCALPPDSIKEAFLKAASAVKSRIFSDDECARDPWEEESSDKVVVVGGGEEKKKDEVVVGGEDVREVGGDRACVDGLVGLDIEKEEKKKKKKNEVNDDDGPILVGGYA